MGESVEVGRRVVCGWRMGRERESAESGGVGLTGLLFVRVGVLAVVGRDELLEEEDM